MTDEQPNVTMRVRVGGNEIEVTGPSEFVERKIAEFLEQQKSLSAPTPSVAAHPSEVSEVPTKAMSPAQFFSRIKPKTVVDRVLAAGYFLEKFEQQDSFTASEVAQIIHNAKHTPPKNTNESINGNIRKGYIMTAGDKEGKMAFVLTSDGEEAIAALFNE